MYSLKLFSSCFRFFYVSILSFLIVSKCIFKKYSCTQSVKLKVSTFFKNTFSKHIFYKQTKEILVLGKKYFFSQPDRKLPESPDNVNVENEKNRYENIEEDIVPKITKE